MNDSIELLNYCVEVFILILFPYLCGSIPFGLIITRMAGLGDIRTIGSGNIGATNVLRTGHKFIALSTLLLDSMKGLIPTLALKDYLESAYNHLTIAGGGPPWDKIYPFLYNHLYPIDEYCILVVASSLSIIGHMFPVWLKFKGGKGVATAFGVYFGLSLFAGAVAAAIWLAVFLFSRYSSLASITAFCIAPLILWARVPALLLLYPDTRIYYVVDVCLWNNTFFHLTLFALGLLIAWRHKDNIRRLQAGTESKFKKPA